jgi:1-acyl-sn-glycerol-3-phosphate acyltransferase
MLEGSDRVNGLNEQIDERLDRLEVDWNRYGIDPYGASRQHLRWMFGILGVLYRRYFSMKVFDIHNVPARGRTMLVGNHSGGVSIDGAMVIAACFFEMDPPRLAQGMADKFIGKIPFASVWAERTGQLPGLPQHAHRLLEDERLLLVFPEGARGTAKLYSERNSLVDFGKGFLRTAMKARAPIIPFGFIGGGEAMPTFANAYSLGKLLGVPYIPLTPYLLPLPLPAMMQVRFGEPMFFAGDGTEDDEIVLGYVDAVRERIRTLIDEGQKPQPVRLNQDPDAPAETS